MSAKTWPKLGRNWRRIGEHYVLPAKHRLSNARQSAPTLAEVRQTLAEISQHEAEVCRVFAASWRPTCGTCSKRCCVEDCSRQVGVFPECLSRDRRNGVMSERLLAQSLAAFAALHWRPKYRLLDMLGVIHTRPVTRSHRDFADRPRTGTGGCCLVQQTNARNGASSI